VKEYVGGYADWLRQRSPPPEASRPKPTAARPEQPATAPTNPAGPAKKKLSFKEQRELDSLPGRIESLEAEIAAAHAAMTAADYYRQPGDVLARDQARLRELEADLAAAFTRWESLG
jgi:ATP-binding cassette subfamily F protein uup